jgi:hypothetical protein
MKMKDIDCIGLRLQPELKAWVKAEAKKNQRSANSEIVFILEKEKALHATNTQGFDVNPNR